MASNGYVLVKVGAAHHLADSRGYAYEHRLVAEKKIGRPLQRGEIVHHLDRCKTNNAPENLEILPTIAHHRHEHGLRKDSRAPGEINPLVVCLCGCGAAFLKYDRNGRPRKFVSGHNVVRNERKQFEARP